MEFDVREFLLRKSQCVACISQEHIAVMLILRHIGVLAAFEILQLLIVITLYPTSLMYRYRLPATLRSVLMLQTILNNLEL